MTKHIPPPSAAEEYAGPAAEAEARRPFRIAIDGPAGAGKSTVASALSRSLSFMHLNTGVLYRALSLEMLRRFTRGSASLQEKLRRISGLLAKDGPEVAAFLGEFSVALEKESVVLGGEDVTAQLRSPEIDRVVGTISKFPAVRAKVGDIQRQIIRTSAVGVVVEGRDIGTVVIPDAELKIFLDASVKVRAQRRAQQIHSASVETVERDMRERDELDRTRKCGPLKKAADAVVVDNSDKPAEETVREIVQLVKKARALRTQ